MNTKMEFICPSTQDQYDIHLPIWHGADYSLLDITLKKDLKKDQIKTHIQSIWRYGSFLPIENKENIVSLGEGFTPLIPIKINNKEVGLKLDYLAPSGSFKDRGSSVLISKIKELGIKKVVEDSSGNAGSSIAAYSNNAAINCSIYVSTNTSKEKKQLIAFFGQELVEVTGRREDVAQKAFEAAQKSYYASHVWNPFFFQGTKTWAYEVCEQMNWQTPDAVVLPVGNGSLLIGAYIGFKELYLSGLITKLPKLIAVQAANCAPLFYAFHGIDHYPTTNTIAEGISIAKPRRLDQMIGILKETKGNCLKIEEKEIISGLSFLLKKGYFIEPSSAIIIKGLQEYLNQHPHEYVISTLTGSGFKSWSKILQSFS